MSETATKITSIRVTEATRARIADLGAKGDSFDKILNDVLDRVAVD